MIERFDRILVLGHCGAGKSTLAVELGERLRLPVVHLDRLSWLPGWEERDRELFKNLQRDAAAGERWIIEGNYSSTLPLRLPRAQAAIWLDYPLWLCLWRIVRRLGQWRGRVRPDMGDGCPERLNLEFIHWTITHHGVVRRRVRKLLHGQGAHIQLFRFTNPGQTRSFLRALRPARPAAGQAPTATAP